MDIKSLLRVFFCLATVTACCVGLASSCSQCSAQYPEGPPPPDDGQGGGSNVFTQFSFSPIRSLSIDPSGGKWIGASAGIYYLDDKGTPTNTSDDTLTLVSSNDQTDVPVARAIAIDASGGKWLCTLVTGVGLTYFNDNGTPTELSDDTWKVYHTDSFGAIAIDGSGGKWFATYINPFGSGIRYLDDNGTPTDLTDDTWTSFGAADGLGNDSVFGIAVDGAGGKWFATYFSGGASYLDDNGTPTNKSDDTWVNFTTVDGLAGDDLLSVAVDSSDRKWFGSEGNGVSCLDDNGTPTNKADDTWTTFTTADGLSDNNVQWVSFDAAGGKWFGTRKGLSYLNDNGTPSVKGDDTWVTYSTTDGLPYEVVGSVTVDAAGNTWLIVGNNVRMDQTGGSIVYLGQNGTPTNKGDDAYVPFYVDCGLVGNNVAAIAVDAKGNKWFGARDDMTSLGGVSYFGDGGTPSEKADDTWVVFTSADGLVDNDVRAAAADPLGTTWFGTPMGLSNLGDNGTPADKSDDTWTSFTTSDGLPSNDVTSISIDAAGKKWIGTSAGLCYLNDNSTPSNKGDDIWQSFTTAQGLVDDGVLTIGIDSSGYKWVGTANGVSCLNDNGTPTNLRDDQVTSFTNIDGLTDNHVTGVAFDPAGGVWFSTSMGGMSYLDYGSTLNDKSDDVWIHFGTSDGLESDGVGCVTVDQEGIKWFGTTYPSRLDDNGTPGDKSDDDWTVYEIAGAPMLINTIVVDGKNGKWFGAYSGVSYHP